MTENDQSVQATQSTETPHDTSQPAGSDSLRNMAMAVWIAHLVGLVTSGIGSIVAVVICYVQRKEAQGSVYIDHFNQGIATFWWGLAGGVIAFILTVVSAGILMFLFFVPAVYVIYKSVKGLIRVNESRAYAA